MSDSSRVLKVATADGSMTRRVMLASSSSVDAVVAAACAALSLSAAEVARVSYVDDDYDEVAVRTQADLDAAWAWVESSGYNLKLTVTTHADVADAAQDAPAELDDGAGWGDWEEEEEEEDDDEEEEQAEEPCVDGAEHDDNSNGRSDSGSSSSSGRAPSAASASAPPAVVDIDLGPVAAALPALMEQVTRVAPDMAVQVGEAVQRAAAAGADVPQAISALLPNVEVVLKEVVSSADAAVDNVADALRGLGVAPPASSSPASATAAASAAATAAAAGGTAASLLPVHFGVVCDGCGARPIRGRRFKCVGGCPDFDLCEACRSSADPVLSHRHHAMAERDAVHRFVRCDVCSTSPVRGVRYKCSVCPDWDACESCEATNPHPQHALLKIRVPGTPYGHPAPSTCPGMRAAAAATAPSAPAVSAPTTDASRLAASFVPVVPPVPASATTTAATASAAPLNSPPIPARERFAEAHAQLVDMGFLDLATNARLLDRHNGDVTRVVRDLLAL